MKGRDLYCFLILVFLSGIGGLFIWHDGDFNYSDVVMFLSILVGFEITSLSILFNSPLRKKLWDSQNIKYKTELHRIGAYYQHSIGFAVISVITLFVVPSDFKIDIWKITLGKYSLVPPILGGSAYCLYKVCKDLFRIFTYPTNN